MKISIQKEKIMSENLFGKFSVFKTIVIKSIENTLFPSTHFCMLITFILIIQSIKQALPLPPSISVEPGKILAYAVFIMVAQLCKIKVPSL